MDLFLVPKNEPRILDTEKKRFKSGELSLLDLPSGIAISPHYLVLFSGLSAWFSFLALHSGDPLWRSDPALCFGSSIHWLSSLESMDETYDDNL